MSEYQSVVFRAIDAPLSEKNLEYMRQQSSRAEITRWTFANEYHYGDFRGDAFEMLRRGYDIHLHYANFGIRKLLIRLPYGFPTPEAARPYFKEESLRFVKDKSGHGGTLAIEPCHEPGDLNELWNIEELVDKLVPLRAEILAGDLRPLYLAHLVIGNDGNHDTEESIEAPVPAGLAQPTDAQLALANLYGISRALIAAAARDTPPAPTIADQRVQYVEWLRSQSDSTKNTWLAEVMANSSSSIQAELLTAFRKKQCPQSWPTIERKRTFAQLHAVANDVQQELDEKAAATAARARAQKLAKMAADPTPFLQKTEQLVAQRATDAYREASALLADLRKALSDTGQSNLADVQARKLHEKHPTLHQLTAALRREGFLPK
jgi:hypothetical protein